MNALAIINKYYSEENELKHILLTHSRSVADKALQIAVKHPELHLDTGFLEEAALLHDIGIFMTDASGIQCFGTHPYICHGYLGSELLMKEGYPPPCIGLRASHRGRNVITKHHRAGFTDSAS